MSGPCTVNNYLQKCAAVEQLPNRNVQRFRRGLVFKAHRHVYHSTLGLRVIKKKKKVRERAPYRQPTDPGPLYPRDS